LLGAKRIMILTGPEIIRQHGLGAIRIDPFNVDQINPNSYNFRLDRTVKIYKNDVLDPKIKQPTDPIDIPDDALVLDSGRTALAHHAALGGGYLRVAQIPDWSSGAARLAGDLAPSARCAARPCSAAPDRPPAGAAAGCPAGRSRGRISA